MGALDDAIREHIELKRLHGAGEDDLRRQEQEALGPARRESPAPPAEEPEQVAEPEEEAFDDRHTTVMPALEPEGPEHADSADPDGELPDPEEFHEAPPSAVADDEDEDEDEDVLEETPEFLQETPEHDRLWFEQKPPRDFDFDDK